MGIWEGFGTAPVGPSNYGLQTWLDDRSGGLTDISGNELRWWESGPQGGIQFTPSGCFGVSCEEMAQCPEDFDCTGCDECGPAEEDKDCCNSLPDNERCDPFWAKHCLSCNPVGRDPNQLYQQVRNELAEGRWQQMARQMHLKLQDVATDITGPSASSPAEGIGTLYRNRGILGLRNGVLVAPMSAVPILESKGLISQGPGGRSFGPGGTPIIIDEGFPTSGPGGVTPPAGAVYIYAMGARPMGAWHGEIDPINGNYDHQNTRQRNLFMNDKCGCATEECFAPFARQRGIVVVNPCAVFAIAIDIRDCECPDALTVEPVEEP